MQSGIKNRTIYNFEILQRNSPFFLSARVEIWMQDSLVKTLISLGTLSVCNTSVFPLSPFFSSKSSCLITVLITRPEGTLSKILFLYFESSVLLNDLAGTPTKSCKQTIDKSPDTALEEGKHIKELALGTQ